MNFKAYIDVSDIRIHIPEKIINRKFKNLDYKTGNQ